MVGGLPRICAAAALAASMDTARLSRKQSQKPTTTTTERAKRTTTMGNNNIFGKFTIMTRTSEIWVGLQMVNFNYDLAKYITNSDSLCLLVWTV